MPYAELGHLFDFNFGEYWYSGDIWAMDADRRPSPHFALGVVAGVGAEYYINSRQAVSLGVRFNYVSNLSRERKYELLTFELVAGFSLFNF
jgi:hypothetical protein